MCHGDVGGGHGAPNWRAVRVTDARTLQVARLLLAPGAGQVSQVWHWGWSSEPYLDSRKTL